MGKTVKSKKGRVSCEAENISQFNKYERSNGRVCKLFKNIFCVFSKVSYHCKIYGSKIQLL